MANTLEKRLCDTLKGRSNVSAVRQLIEQGVDCNLSHFDSCTLTFIAPIQLAAKNSRRCTLRLLYQRRNSPTKAQLEKRLAFYLNQYQPSEEENNQTLLEYTVSRLLHTDITKHPEEAFSILIAALHNFDDATQRGEKLCIGSTHNMFLQLRIFTLVRRIVDMYTTSLMSPDDETLTILRNELLHNLETYYLFYDIDNIPMKMTDELLVQRSVEVELTNPLLFEFYKCIATNVISKIKQSQPNEEYTIPASWMWHAVCVSFRRISQTHIHIRVDNPIPLARLTAHETARSRAHYGRIKGTPPQKKFPT
jgi:hypothetical protein